MYRYIIIILFLTAFAAHTFQQSVILFDYYTNTASYAKNCENKAKPKMHCNGKCQMMKKMAEEEKTNEQLPERKLENKSEIVSSKSFFSTVDLVAFSTYSKFSSIPSTDRTIQRSFPIFHPPKA